MADKITVLLADDHTLVRRGFRRLLEDDPAIEVIGEASDGDEAIALAARLSPQVVIMDCAMPGMSGLVATERIMARAPKTVVLMLSMHSEATLVRQALAGGARGYVLKDAIDLDLATAVKKAAAGEAVLDPKLTPAASLKGERRDHGLSARELEVLQLICDGHSNRTIARKLGLSINTIAVHRANIMKTLGVHKTAELVVYAIQNGLVNVL
jgi:DNA-binding NarL/FixJ family response regulator